MFASSLANSGFTLLDNNGAEGGNTEEEGLNIQPEADKYPSLRKIKKKE